MTIREIAEDFIKRMNPSGWDGTGNKPNDFDTRIVTYDVDGYPGVEMDLHFEEDDFDGLEEDNNYEWFTVIEGVDKVSSDHLGGLWTRTLSSVSGIEYSLKNYIRDFLTKTMNVTFNRIEVLRNETA